MAALNRIGVIGNLGADPEVRAISGDRQVTSFPVAVNRHWTDAEGQSGEETDWFHVEAWGRLGANCARYLAKGRQVYVEGRLRINAWDAQDGSHHERAVIVANNVQFLGTSSAQQ